MYWLIGTKYPGLRSVPNRASELSFHNINGHTQSGKTNLIQMMALIFAVMDSSIALISVKNSDGETVIAKLMQEFNYKNPIINVSYPDFSKELDKDLMLPENLDLLLRRINCINNLTSDSINQANKGSLRSPLIVVRNSYGRSLEKVLEFVSKPGMNTKVSGSLYKRLLWIKDEADENTTSASHSRNSNEKCTSRRTMKSSIPFQRQ